MIYVTLDNRGNPDFRQNPDARLPGVGPDRRQVKDFAEASRICRAYIEDNDLGGGNWTGGAVTDAVGTEIGRVAYNGVVFPPGPHVVGAQPLYSPGPPVRDVGGVKWETEILEIEGHGSISVGGCLRIGNCNSVPGAFFVGGVRHDFMARAEFTRDAFGGISTCSLMKNGEYSNTVAMPKALKKTIEKAVAEWYAEPSSKMMVMRNEIEDTAREIERLGRIAVNQEQALRQTRKEIAEAEAVQRRNEAALSELGTSGPRP